FTCCCALWRCWPSPLGSVCSCPCGGKFLLFSDFSPFPLTLRHVLGYHGQQERGNSCDHLSGGGRRHYCRRRGTASHILGLYLPCDRELPGCGRRGAAAEAPSGHSRSDAALL